MAEDPARGDVVAHENQLVENCPAFENASLGDPPIASLHLTEDLNDRVCGPAIPAVDPSIVKLDFNSVVPATRPISWLSRLNPFSWLPSWRPTSMSKLFRAETQILSRVKSTLDRFFVNVCNDRHRIWTLIANPSPEASGSAGAHGQPHCDQSPTPVVLIHGMGGGNGIWAMNLDDLAANRTVYSFDLLGFGLSSRPKFSSNPKVVEAEFVESVESWRQALQLKKPFILLGHSLGGFVAASYAFKYPDQVKHLILVDPWGVPEMPKEREVGRDWPLWVKALRVVLQPFNPLAAVRGAGPWGPALVKRFRPDFQRRYAQLFDDDTVFDYIYHLNAQTPSGEAAFKTLAAPFGYAKNPIITSIDQLDPKVPLTFIYGGKSWITSDSGKMIQDLRKDSYVDVQEIKGAGHHVYADRPFMFNQVCNEVFQFVDQHCSNVDASNCCAPPSKDDYEGEMRKEKPRGWAPVKPKKDSQS